jgi:hypothetical protein
LLVGRPKAGKSTLALNASVCIAKGINFLKKFETGKAEVLYISLQENKELMQGNLKRLEQEIPEGLKITFNFPSLNDRGFSILKNYLQKNPETKVVVFDMFIDVRPSNGQRMNSYQEDYRFLGKIGKFAQEQNVSIIVVHHTRKKWAYEVLDSISGTNGLAGAADTIWILDRPSGSQKGFLTITGRGVRERSLKLQFHSGKWIYKGNDEEMKMGPGQKEIFRILKKSPKPLLPSQVAKMIKKQSSNVNHQLISLYQKGAVRKTKKSKYYIPGIHLLKVA